MPDAEDYILIEDTDYIVHEDDGTTARRGRPGTSGRRALWALAAWAAVLLVGLASTPFRDGRPVLATPSYRQVAAHAVLLESAVGEAAAWDAAIEGALEEAGEPFDLANSLREHAEAADAQVRRLGLLRVPEGARAEHLALERWLEEAASYMRELADALVAPEREAGRMAQLQRRWEGLRASREQVAVAVARLRERYPRGGWWR